MGCYHPLKAFKVGLQPSGKDRYKIASYSTNHVYKVGDTFYCSSVPPRVGECHIITDFIEIPCGNCIGCRLDYSRQWADRCLLELGYHEDSCFLTLTYNDENLPRTMYGDLETGEALPAFTLKKRDFQLFMKRLRKYYSDSKIRFFACGEYGSTTFRPHYHAIIFGLRPTDLHDYKSTFNGDRLYTSETLSNIWGKGYVVIGSVSWDSCAYVARYIMKKAKGQARSVYETYNIEPEFVLMSRRPGIAYQYFLDNSGNILHNQVIHISTESGGKKIMPPKYYDKLFDVFYPQEFTEIKAFRLELARKRHDFLMSTISVDYEDYLSICERNKESVIKALERRIE